MSANRKLQSRLLFYFCIFVETRCYVAEIDRVMKKVEEGIEQFDDIWEKVCDV